MLERFARKKKVKGTCKSREMRVVTVLLQRFSCICCPCEVVKAGSCRPIIVMLIRFMHVTCCVPILASVHPNHIFLSIDDGHFSTVMLTTTQINKNSLGISEIDRRTVNNRK